MRILLLGIFFSLGSVLCFAQDRALTLKEALLLASSVNTQIVLADARIGAALGRIDAASASLLPHVDATVQGARQTRDLRSSGMTFPTVGPEIGPFNSFDGRGRITQTLFDVAAIDRLRAARQGRVVSQVDKEKVKEDVLALVAGLYLEAYSSQMRSLAMEAQWRVDQMANDVVEDQFKAGEKSRFQQQEIEARSKVSYALFLKAKTDAFERAMDLKVAIQWPLEDTIIFNDDDDFIKRLSQLNPQTVTPQMRLAKARMEESRLSWQSARNDFWPVIKGLADYGANGASPKASSNTYSVGLMATMSIWDGGLRDGNIKEAKAKFQENEILWKDVERQQNAQSLIAKEKIDAAKQHMEAAQLMLDVAKTALNDTQSQKDVGMSDQISLLQAQARVASALDDLAQAKAQWQMALVQYQHAHGVLGQLQKD